MALQTNSYGDPDEVAKLTTRWADSTTKNFETTTTPTLASVESWCDQVSGMVNSVLAEYGFAIPIADADVLLMLDMFVNDEVASMVEGTHGSGRFGPLGKAKSRGGRPVSKWKVIAADVRAFVGANAVGIERLGATRTYDKTDELSYRSVDESGDTTSPYFQREAFGETWSDVDA